MAAHRFADLLTDRVKSTPLASVSLGGFMACPVVLVQSQPPTQVLWQHQLYQRAYAEAQAVVRPSILERLQAFLEN